MTDIKKVDEAMKKLKEKSKAFTKSHKGKSADDILAQMRGIDKTDDNLVKMAEEYRNFREECGIKDRVMLNEIETAYYEGAALQKRQYSHRILMMVENRRQVWSLGSSAEAKYKAEAYQELLELLKEE